MEWSVDKDEIVASFNIFEARKSTRLNPRNGARFTFFLMQGLDWVNVIPLTSSGEVILVRQYRHGADEVTIEIPGGCIDKSDQNPEASALRELQEETGYMPSAIRPIGVVHANPAMQSMKTYSFLALDCKKIAPQKLDGIEEIEVFTAPLKDVYEMIRSKKITHALVVAAFAHLLLSTEIGGGAFGGV